MSYYLTSIYDHSALEAFSKVTYYVHATALDITAILYTPLIPMITFDVEVSSIPVVVQLMATCT